MFYVGVNFGLSNEGKDTDWVVLERRTKIKDVWEISSDESNGKLDKETSKRFYKIKNYVKAEEPSELCLEVCWNESTDKPGENGVMIW